jgi:hypothetical protein
MVATPEVEVDRDLVERAARADREAFAVLVHQVSDSLKPRAEASSRSAENYFTRRLGVFDSSRINSA